MNESLRQGLSLALPALVAGIGLRKGGVPAAAGLTGGLLNRFDYEAQQRAAAEERAQILAAQEARRRAEEAERKRAFLMKALEMGGAAQDEQDYAQRMEALAQLAPEWGVDPQQITSLPGLAQGRGEDRYLKALSGAFETLTKQYGPPAEWAQVPGLLDSQFPVPGVRGRKTVREILQAVTPVSQAGEIVIPPVAKPKATPGSFEDYVTTTPERQADLRRLRKEFQQADDYPRVTVNMAPSEDIGVAAQMLVDGYWVPSMLSKRGDTYYKILAEAARRSQAQTGKPYNATKAQTNFNAAQRFVTSMNGPQMVRFKALATSVVNTIDEVRSLAEELKQGGVQLWNRARRESLLQVYGNTPYSDTAVRYLGAINTLKEEFANLAQGGYAPTEAAWALANAQINTNYGVKDLTASLHEVQRLINYRMQAFDQLAPLTFSVGQGLERLGPPPEAPGHGAATTAAPPTKRAIGDVVRKKGDPAGTARVIEGMTVDGKYILSDPMPLELARQRMKVAR